MGSSAIVAYYKRYTKLSDLIILSIEIIQSKLAPGYIINTQERSIEIRHWQNKLIHISYISPYKKRRISLDLYDVDNNLIHYHEDDMKSFSLITLITLNNKLLKYNDFIVKE